MFGLLRAVLADRSDVRLAFAFGSAARGEQRPESDVDIAISGTADLLPLAADLSRAAGREVDVVRLEAATIPLLRAILRDGVLLRERDSGAEAEFRSRTLAALELDLPWYERMRSAYIQRVAREGV